eukprot:CAMPEP_0202029308 /NCGR_PEP_ID=MMETSP0905-20130828/63907_1 /ASSEMBLY_ACC=CAM_ASM_000554 /TAXON_ID=420261 /ORGANISM="Thalassiosira antarctica, Strain CCMP982" /LENGTH=279 /DNA_ID=CAMNT_0048593057 /DNA_START=78 /DNA_END=917 /DNA_ORIENTATION=-
MPLWNEDDRSLSKDSVFDWGSLPEQSVGVSTSTSVQGQTTAGNGHLARYDPKTLHRITDITDLVDDSSEDSDDDAVIGSHSSVQVAGADEENGKRRNRSTVSASRGGAESMLCCRQVIILVSLIATIAAAGLAIRYAVISSNPSKSSNSVGEGGEIARGGNGIQEQQQLLEIAERVVSSNPSKSSNSVGEGGEIARGGNGIQEQQQLLEIAERVVTACSENKLNGDMSECQKLCHSNMCCFESGEYSCEDDESKDCAVYAGCEALVQGIPLEAAEEDEE